MDARTSISPDQTRFYAQLARIPYQKHNATRRKHLHDIGRGSLVYRPEHSNDRIATVIDSDNKKVYISYRGSKSWDDWVVSDLNIARGQHRKDKYFMDATKHFDGLHKKYGNEYEFNLTGHSLGGAISQYVHTHAKQQGARVQTHTFNAPHVIDRLNQEDLYHYRTDYDPVSLLHQHDAVYVGEGGHSLENFL